MPAGENPLAVGLELGRQAPPVVLVVFGASGDLTKRKLLPSLAAMARRRRLTDNFAVVGVARTELSDDEFRQLAIEAVPGAGPEWTSLVATFRYVSGEYGHPDTFDALRTVLSDLDDERGTAGNRVFYLATIPDQFGVVAGALGEHGLSRPEKGSFARLVIEKPFGRDPRSARELDAVIHSSFDEDQIYRIDH